MARALRCAWPGERASLILEFTAKLAEHAAFEEKTLFPILQENLGTARLAGIDSEMVSKQRVQTVKQNTRRSRK